MSEDRKIIKIEMELLVLFHLLGSGVLAIVSVLIGQQIPLFTWFIITSLMPLYYSFISVASKDYSGKGVKVLMIISIVFHILLMSLLYIYQSNYFTDVRTHVLKEYVEIAAEENDESLEEALSYLISKQDLINKEIDDTGFFNLPFKNTIRSSYEDNRSIKIYPTVRLNVPKIEIDQVEETFNRLVEGSDKIQENNYTFTFPDKKVKSKHLSIVEHEALVEMFDMTSDNILNDTDFNWAVIKIKKKN